MREKEGYRDLIERISLIYPGKVDLSVQEASKVLGVDRRTINQLIATKRLHAVDLSCGGTYKKIKIPVTSIAKMLTT